MGFFERPDPRLAQSAEPSAAGALLRALKRHALACGICLVVLGAAYALDIAAGLHEAAPTRGEFRGSRTLRPGDDRARPPRYPAHSRANEHDLYFAKATSKDRTGSFNSTSRAATRTAGSPKCSGLKHWPIDEMQRAADIAGIARRQLRAMAPRDRAAVIGIQRRHERRRRDRQPLPVEFRMLLLLARAVDAAGFARGLDRRVTRTGRFVARRLRARRRLACA